MIPKFLRPSTIHRFFASYKDNERGQTSIEYILMVAVVMFMIITIMKNVKNRLIAEQTPCPISDKSLGCTISRAVSTFGSDPTFRFFNLRR